MHTEIYGITFAKMLQELNLDGKFSHSFSFLSAIPEMCRFSKVGMNSFYNQNKVITLFHLKYIY